MAFATRKSRKPLQPSPVTWEDLEPWMRNNPILQRMKARGLTPTRKVYLDLNYMGRPPERLGSKEETELPEPFQTQ